MDSQISVTKSHRGGIVAGGLLILFGVLSLLETFMDLDVLLWVGVLAIGAIILFALWAIDRKERWILIPAYAMAAVAGLIVVSEFELVLGSVSALVLFSLIALPFVVGFAARPRERWGLLIPAYVLIAIGVMIFLLGENWLLGDLVPVYVMGAIALPFWIVLFRNFRNWWAVFPAGIATAFALAFLIESDVLRDNVLQLVAPVALILGGALLVVRQFAGRRRAQTVEPLPKDEELTTE